MTASPTEPRADPTASGWCAFGELVLDRLLGTARCERALVGFLGDVPPRPAEVRRAFRLPSSLPITLTDEMPRPVCTLDEIVLLPTCELFDPRGNDPPDEPAVDLLTYDLRAEDILHLDRMHRRYPEVRFDTELLRFLACATVHLRALAPSFEELGLLLAAYAPHDAVGGRQVRP